MTDDQPKRGRPSDYSFQVAISICDRLAEGKSLRAICSEAAMPGRATVFRWIARHKEFRDEYTLACEQEFFCSRLRIGANGAGGRHRAHGHGRDRQPPGPNRLELRLGVLGPGPSSGSIEASLCRGICHSR